MKLYWKHILWNHTTRLWYFWKYRNHKWKSMYCLKLVQTGKEMEAYCKRIDECIAELSSVKETPNETNTTKTT